VAQRSFLLIALLSVTACGTKTVVHDLGEKEANSIVVLLAGNEIHASKIKIDDGRNVSYNINVSDGDSLEAMRLLAEHDHPWRTIKGYSEVFGEGGLIPTAAEEKAKKLSAIEGEIERQLRLIAGVLDVEVNIVMPEEDALRTAEEEETPTTASVTLRYLPGKEHAKPITEASVQKLVAAAVEKLKPDRVVVHFAEQGDASGKVVAAAECPPASGKGGVLSRLSARGQTVALAAVIGLVLLLGLGLVFGQIRLRMVRGRLVRLQEEIAKARRRVTGDSSPIA